MSKNSELLEPRLKLDQAITYGAKKKALALARKYLQQAQDKKLPGEVEYFKGQVEMLKNNFVLAIEHFDQAVKINPNDGAAYNDRALCMVELGIIDEAIKYFDLGIKVEADYATVYHNKGWLLNNIGRHKEAIKCFNQALALEPNRAVTFDNLADAYFNLGKLDEAQAAYKRVLKLLKPGEGFGIRKQIQGKIKCISAQLRGKKTV